jgi:hypothetical protein
MSLEDHQSDDHRSDSVPRRIDLGNDVLVLDADFMHDILGGCTRRTGSKPKACHIF